ncbi:hypothetical protein THRCLA_11647 [Thraustotheca clavata]|uniref:FYVE-type domain-containing protein n=1 Tax=Thraustotheca clavata TaxID=74557 RepID=A0A1V9Y782_9STRA|nr:hypothetical protein THRCLA_11647 [Thraustotheca clavata]
MLRQNSRLGAVHWSDLKRGDEWIDDNLRSNCYICNRKFNLFRRRHHCRMCGEVVCTSCTGFVQMITTAGPERSIRICGVCLVRNKTQMASDRPELHRGATLPVQPRNNRMATMASMTISAPGVRPTKSRYAPSLSVTEALTQSEGHRFSESSSDICSSSGLREFSEQILCISVPLSLNGLPPPPMPWNETTRLSTLYQYNIIDSSQERSYQAISDLLAKGYNCPYAGVSFIDADRCWFKATTNLEVDELPRTIAFCSHAIMSTKPTIVMDMTSDVRFLANPLVTGELHIKFYAAAPIVVDDDIVLGTVFVFDTMPHSDLVVDSYLIKMAKMVVKQLDSNVPRQRVASQRKEMVLAPPSVTWSGKDATPVEMQSMLADLLHRTNQVQEELAMRTMQR